MVLHWAHRCMKADKREVLTEGKSTLLWNGLCVGRIGSESILRDHPHSDWTFQGQEFILLLLNTYSLWNYIDWNLFPFVLSSWGLGWGCGWEEAKIICHIVQTLIPFTSNCPVGSQPALPPALYSQGRDTEWKKVGWEGIIKLDCLLKITEKWSSEDLADGEVERFVLLMTAKCLLLHHS